MKTFEQYLQETLSGRFDQIAMALGSVFSRQELEQMRTMSPQDVLQQIQQSEHLRAIPQTLQSLVGFFQGEGQQLSGAYWNGLFSQAAHLARV
jgi:hypothetical protein